MMKKYQTDPDKRFLPDYAKVSTYPVYLLHTRLGKTLFDLLFQDMSKYVALTIVISFVIVLSFLVYTYIDKRVSGYIKINLSKIFPKQLLLWGRSDYR
jgi:peptidoglycan/LPS O-acetylase OafA/YrhL